MKKGFTLVELLAVIVILAVILVIVAPIIGDTLDSSNEKVFKLNTEQAIKIAKTHYQNNFGSKLISTPVIYEIENNKMTQNDVDVDLSTSMGDMTGEIIINSDGNAKVKLYNDEFCVTKSFKGTLAISELVNGRCNSLEDIFIAKVGTGGLIEDDYGDLRYQGSDPDNYVTFNDETAGWRIVGLFNVDGEQRIKLVKKDSIGAFSWDSSDSSVNDGKGINEWSQADLNILLNNYYYNGAENEICYNGLSNANITCSFDGLTNDTKELIDSVEWNLGATEMSKSLSEVYYDERGSNTCESYVEEGAVGCDTNGIIDNVHRSVKWHGLVGLIYSSDYAYASADASCKNALNGTCENNWMSSYGWTITPDFLFGVTALYAGKSRMISYTTRLSKEVHPSIYLISDVKVTGSGTTSDPYVFTK
ncbi:MAG: type II secretion system protein [Bacilli bacterium]|nr:type II secretion system protein [Bacilli bacterium]